MKVMVASVYCTIISDQTRAVTGAFISGAIDGLQ